MSVVYFLNIILTNTLILIINRPMSITVINRLNSLRLDYVSNFTKSWTSDDFTYEPDLGQGLLQKDWSTFVKETGHILSKKMLT